MPEINSNLHKVRREKSQKVEAMQEKRRKIVTGEIIENEEPKGKKPRK